MIVYIIGSFSIVCFFKPKIMINVILNMISMYVHVYDKIVYMLPKNIYLQQYKYTLPELSKEIVIYEYSINKNGKFTNIKFIQEDNSVNQQEYISKYIDNVDINSVNIINTCCILDKNNNYKLDITHNIRPFMHHLKEHDNKSNILWNYILLDLNLNKEHALYMCINDDDLTEQILYIKELENKIFSINI